MTLQQIRYILEISRCGSISKAAQQLLLTQPYLSSILKDLENELGITIFRRDRRGVTLTEEGREFLYYARPMLEQEQRIEALYSKRTAKPPLHVSISTQRYPFVIQAFMRFFQKWDPERYEICLRECGMYHVINHVYEKKSDLGIIFLSGSTEAFIRKYLDIRNIQFNEIVSIAPCVFFHKDHPMARHAEVDMEEMARAMSRMNSSGKATLEFLNIFQDRGVDVIGMLGEALGKTQGDIYSMISKGEINGQTAANIIQAGMESAYKGSMEEMAVTFSGLTSTLEDTMTEIDNARGEGYNAERSGGLQAEIDAYGGALGQAVESLNAIAGQNEAYLENLSEQYTREALSAVLLGETPSGIYGPEQQEELVAMREEYQAASEAYASGSQEAGLKMDSLRREAEALAKIAYESSEQYQTVHDTELDLIEAIRENTAALSGWRNGYNIQQALSKGSLVNLIGENSLVGQAMGFFSGASALVGTGSETTTGLSVEERQAGNWRRGGYYDEDGVWRSHAAGLERVPYDGYAALLHEGERVLTAREARQADQGGGARVTITGNTFQVRQESDIDAIAEALYRRLRLAQMGGVR